MALLGHSGHRQARDAIIWQHFAFNPELSMAHMSGAPGTRAMLRLVRPSILLQPARDRVATAAETVTA